MSLWSLKPEELPEPKLQTRLLIYLLLFSFCLVRDELFLSVFQLVLSADVSQPSALFDPPSWLIFRPF